MLGALRPSPDFGRPRDGGGAPKRDLARRHLRTQRNMVMPVYIPPPPRAEYPPIFEIEEFAKPGGLRPTP